MIIGWPRQRPCYVGVITIAASTPPNVMDLAVNPSMEVPAVGLAGAATLPVTRRWRVGVELGLGLLPLVNGRGGNLDGGDHV